MGDVTPDWKTRRRIVNSNASRSKLEADPLCRCGCGERASEGHHILLRSQGGDDVENNIAPLTFRCHRAYHDGKLKLKIKPDELRYVIDRLGSYDAALSYLERRRVEYK